MSLRRDGLSDIEINIDDEKILNGKKKTTRKAKTSVEDKQEAKKTANASKKTVKTSKKEA